MVFLFIDDHSAPQFSWRHGDDQHLILPRVRTAAGLLEGGIFFVVRYPIYSGFSLVSLGWSLMWNSLATFIAAFLLLVFFAYKGATRRALAPRQVYRLHSIQIAGEEADPVRLF
jgi:protein-S-isoprenylcysteine O-methyltransferase Ste14